MKQLYKIQLILDIKLKDGTKYHFSGSNIYENRNMSIYYDILPKKETYVIQDAETLKNCKNIYPYFNVFGTISTDILNKEFIKLRVSSEHTVLYLDEFEIIELTIDYKIVDYSFETLLKELRFAEFIEYLIDLRERKKQEKYNSMSYEELDRELLKQRIYQLETENQALRMRCERLSETQHEDKEETDETDI